MNEKELIASRAAALLQPGWVVNLGIGIPTLVPRFVDVDALCFQTENGLLGVGPPPEPDRVDPNLVDAGKRPVTQRPGAAFFDSATSFAMIRGGHVDLSVLGAMEVDQEGNLANWMIPGKMVKGMGGAMDLVAGARRVIIAMEHTTKDGQPKILTKCSLPLTGVGVVNHIATEMAWMTVTPKGLLLEEVAPGLTADDVQRATGAKLILSPQLKTMNA